jgi:short-subunit dehydrogenase
VIAVSSLTGVAGEPLNSAYGATKAALTSVCETLNTEESQGGVIATAVCPGYVATDMTAPLADAVAPESMIDADDVAEMVISLTRLSRSVVVPYVPMTRPGAHLWRA